MKKRSSEMNTPVSKTERQGTKNPEEGAGCAQCEADPEATADTGPSSQIGIPNPNNCPIEVYIEREKARLEQEIADIKEDRYCYLCKVNRSDVLFISCHHVVMCNVCCLKERILKCRQCGEDIKGEKKLYLV